MKKLALSLTLLALTLAVVPAVAAAEAPEAEVASPALNLAENDVAAMVPTSLETVLPTSVIDDLGSIGLRACEPEGPNFCWVDTDCPPGCVCDGLNCCAPGPGGGI